MLTRQKARAFLNERDQICLDKATFASFDDKPARYVEVDFERALGNALENNSYLRSSGAVDVVAATNEDGEETVYRSDLLVGELGETDSVGERYDFSSPASPALSWTSLDTNDGSDSGEDSILEAVNSRSPGHVDETQRVESCAGQKRSHSAADSALCSDSQNEEYKPKKRARRGLTRKRKLDSPLHSASGSHRVVEKSAPTKKLENCLTHTHSEQAKVARRRKHSQRVSKSRKGATFAAIMWRLIRRRRKKPSRFQVRTRSLPKYEADVDLESSDTAFTGVRPEVDLPSLQPLSFYKKKGLKHITWDGTYSLVLIDKAKRIVGVFAARPTTSNWDKVMNEVERVLGDAYKLAQFSEDEVDGRRGRFGVLNSGLYHGQGHKEPKKLNHSKRHQDIIDELLSNWAIQAVAKYQCEAFAFYFPKIYSYYEKHLSKLQDEFAFNFVNSIFPLLAANLGPQTVSQFHRDLMNFFAGICPVTPAGNFDYKKGGHMLLREFNIAVDFPVGTAALIPSASVTHGNTRLDKKSETRYSLTQFASGHLFSWDVFGGLQSELLDKDPARYEALHGDAGSQARYDEALSNFSKFSQLSQDQDSVFKKSANK